MVIHLLCYILRMNHVGHKFTVDSASHGRDHLGQPLEVPSRLNRLD